MSSSVSVSAAPSINFDDYTMSPDNTITDMRRGGRFDIMQILTYTDGTEWVFLDNKPTERFCGFLYLQNALNEMGLTKLRAAENKMALNGRQIIYLSQYCGETRPGFTGGSGPIDKETFHELSVLDNEIGFTDTAGMANLRKKEDAIYVFDTEKTSFASTVRDKIDAFRPLHDQIRASLEARLV